MTSILVSRRLVPAALLLALVGCHVERPLGTTVPAPATRVTAELTDSGTVAMANLIGAGATRVEGEVASADGTAWELALQRVHHRDGRAVAWSGERVRFPRTALTDPRERSLDRTRSWITAGAVVAAALLAAAAFEVVGGGDETTPPPIPPASILRPAGGTP